VIEVPEVTKPYDSTGEQLRVPCPACRIETKHLVIKAVDIQDSDEEHGVSWATSHQLVQCQGCETVSYRSVSSNSEETDQETGQPYESIDYYPSRHRERRPLDDIELVPKQLRRIYEETVQALNRNQPILCGIGVRAVVETVAKDQKATGTLSKQIDNLVSLGVLAKEGAAILHKLRVLGNKAAHEVKAHSPKELKLAVDVIDHLLDAVYILPSQAKSTFK
jgi:hypothetical protein